MNKSTGRDVIGLLLDESTILTGDGTSTKTVKGHIYGVKQKSNGTSIVPEGVAEGKGFFAQSELTLDAGSSTGGGTAKPDILIDLGSPFDKTNLIGYARSKDITRSKNTVDMTVDGDDDSDTKVEPLVAVSGNINGYKVNNLPATSASRKIDAKFNDQIIEAKDGTVTTLEKNDDVCLLALVYIKDMRANSQVEIDIQPVTFSSNGDSTDYGSATSKSVAFSGCAVSDSGIKPFTLSVDIATE